MSLRTIPKTLTRRERKRESDHQRLNKRNSGWRGDYVMCDLGCGGSMSWCSCCETYTSNCCVDYGTCMCS